MKMTSAIISPHSSTNIAKIESVCGSFTICLMCSLAIVQRVSIESKSINDDEINI